MTPRYSIGIDLGTTNSALAYVDLGSTSARSQILTIEQWEAAERPCVNALLPSAIYLPAAHERDQRFRLPFQSSVSVDAPVVGYLARAQAGYGSDRVIQSAKSWLCNPQTDPYAAILPWGADGSQLAKLSPVDAAACVLKHFKDYWNYHFSAIEHSRFEDQEVCITVPASFDEVAQRLTLDAAQKAGYPNSVRLLEEPQAAFYFWLQRYSGTDEFDAYFPTTHRSHPKNILVVDVGGGTTDLTLFEISFPSESKFPSIKRVAVSEHLLLGGDNIDLTLAVKLEPLLSNVGRLGLSAWNQLLTQCRSLKERAFEKGLPEQAWHVSVSGSGSSLIAQARSASISSAELREILLEGFFPLVSADTRPQREAGALKHLGLPYAADSAITKHIAEFLAGRSVDALLCNGGALKPTFLQQRLCEQIAAWQGGKAPTLLPSESMDLAVAHGAAWYGHTISSEALKIQAGYPHSVYLEVQGLSPQSERQLVCLVPRGTQAGTRHVLNGRRFSLVLNRAINFQLRRSSQGDAGPTESVGDLCDPQAKHFFPLPPMQTRLSTQKSKQKEVEVQLIAELSETGLLRLFCESVSTNQEKPFRCELSFDLRSQSSTTEETPPMVMEHTPDYGVSAEQLRSALDLLSQLFGKPRESELSISVKNLGRELEGRLRLPREEWNLALLRLLWTGLAVGISKRGRSPAHETSWLNLAGFLLRPGYGSNMDRFYVAEAWRVFDLGLAFPKEKRSTDEWWIFWRRIAGGLSARQQEQLFDQAFSRLTNDKDGSLEAIRLLGSLERLDITRKERLCSHLLRKIDTSPTLRSASLLALGRLGSRTPLYAGPEAVLPPGWIEKWFIKLGERDWTQPGWRNCISLFCQACRLVESRELNVSNSLREQVLSKLQQSKASPTLVLPLQQLSSVDDEYQSQLFGEALPHGLRLIC